MSDDYTKVDAAIAKANAKLYHAKIGRDRSSLTLRATLPPKPGKSGKPKQQRISLGLKAYPGAVGVAAGKATQLEADILQGRFDWADWIEVSQGSKQSLSEAIEAYTEHHWDTHEKTVHREANFKKDKLAVIKKLPSLDPQAIVDYVRAAPAGGRARIRRVDACQAFAKFLDLGLDLREYRTKYEPQQDRKLIWSDDDIERIVESCGHPDLRAAIVLGALYGLRNHEVCRCHAQDIDRENGGALWVPGETKTGERWSFPIVPKDRDWLERWKPWEIRVPEDVLPATENALELANRYLTNRITQKVKDSHLPTDFPGFSFKQLRHTWEHRCLSKYHPEHCSRWCGHSLNVSKAYYTRNLSLERQAEIFSKPST